MAHLAIPPIIAGWCESSFERSASESVERNPELALSKTLHFHSIVIDAESPFLEQKH